MDQMSVGKTSGEESNSAERQAQRSNPAAATTKGDGGEHESGEAERQRIERLGRERPSKLKSFAAELFFCYSVIASQFMAVSCSGGLIDVDMKIELDCRNISCLGSMLSFQPFWSNSIFPRVERSGQRLALLSSRQPSSYHLVASLTNMAPIRSSSLDWCGSAFGPSLSDLRSTNLCWIFAGHFRA